MKPPTAWMTDH